MGTVGGLFAIAGVIILPITSGDTAFRALRLMIAEQFHIDQKVSIKRVILSLIIFIPAVAILFFAKSNADGFNLLWRYFGFTNQFVAVFALALITVYLKAHGKNYLISLIPGLYYTFIVMTYIFHEPIGFGLEKRFGFDPNSYTISYILGGICVVLFYLLIMRITKKRKDEIIKLDGLK